MFLGHRNIDDTLSWSCQTTNTSGDPTDADGNVAWAIYEDETSTALLSGNMTKLGSITGYYTETVTLSAANGFEIGKDYHIRITATVGGVNGVTHRYFTMAGVDMNSISGNSSAASKLSASAETIILAAVDSAGYTPSTSEFETSDITEATANHFKGRIIMWRDGVLVGQKANITAYTLTGGRGHFTVETMTDAPSNGDKFDII